MYIHVCWYDGRETISQNIISRDRYRIENYKLAGGGWTQQNAYIKMEEIPELPISC